MALIPMSLRVEDQEGRTVAEYRLWEEHVEVRHLPLSGDNEGGWYQLTADDLTSHVSRNTAVAQWLTRRLGWQRLLRACVGAHNVFRFGAAENQDERRAA